MSGFDPLLDLRPAALSASNKNGPGAQMLIRRSLHETAAKATLVGGFLNGIFFLLAAPLPAILTVHAWMDDERPKAIAGAFITAAFLAGSAYSFAFRRWAKRREEARARETA